MAQDFEEGQGKSIGDLGNEAVWFAGHTIIALVMMIVTIAVMGIFHPNPDASMPKYIGTLLVFLVPLLAGFIIAKIQGNAIAKYVWISGLLMFSAICVWVIDLPTGPGLCEHCLVLDRLWRTFFSINNGSGLLGGQGLMVGTWAPLSLIAYATGAKYGLEEKD